VVGGGPRRAREPGRDPARAHPLSVAGWEEVDDAESERYLRDHGMPADLAAASTRAEIGTAVELAAPTRLVSEGHVVDAGARRWRVLHLPGHADGHIALHDERGGRLLGGDVLLDEITPNVGRWPDTDPDPLGRYLATLRRVAGLAPAIVFPGHGPVIRAAAERAAEIAGHHDERLDVTAAARPRRGDLHLERLAATGRAVEHRPARWRPPG
jgi:glyoxylase-like metal-dependent hydrolase (beta-lactamase superfamily II)